MTENVSTLDVRKRLGDLLNRVALRHDQFVIERKGKPLAAMIPVEKLEQLERLARRHVRDVLARPRPRPPAQGSTDALANEAKHRSRRKTPKKS